MFCVLFILHTWFNLNFAKIALWNQKSNVANHSQYISPISLREPRRYKFMRTPDSCPCTIYRYRSMTNVAQFYLEYVDTDFHVSYSNFSNTDYLIFFPDFHFTQVHLKFNHILIRQPVGWLFTLLFLMHMNVI